MSQPDDGTLPPRAPSTDQLAPTLSPPTDPAPPMPQETLDFPAGRTSIPEAPSSLNVPGYTIESVLGRGGMGIVYKARQAGLNRQVALKMILNADHAGPDERMRFLREAEALAKLQHPNIVQIHEVGEHDGKPFFNSCRVGGVFGTHPDPVVGSEDSITLQKRPTAA